MQDDDMLFIANHQHFSLPFSCHGYIAKPTKNCVPLPLLQLILLLMHEILQRLAIPLEIRTSPKREVCDVESLGLEGMDEVRADVLRV